MGRMNSWREDEYEDMKNMIENKKKGEKERRAKKKIKKEVNVMNQKEGKTEEGEQEEGRMKKWKNFGGFTVQ